ncbi:MlaD family protein [Desulfovibrio inopinatus]|uniref:MlaD family protein n=1 Tax=Desulfovibrio inopinatus TaxID=102109 RepID=UPI00041CCC58|nr:MlaD family protein [Desulfovibrio inopinatus]
METKANYVLIGAFTVLVALGAVVFILWTAKLRMDSNVKLYEIDFTGPVSGLTKAGDVFFNGIKVGQVKDIKIDPTDPTKVKVYISIAGDTPVREDSVAKLELQGITGVSAIQISGGTKESPLLFPKHEDEIPTIQSARSDLQKVFESLPQIMTKASKLLDRINMLVDADNRKSVASILNNIESITQTLAQKDTQLSDIINNIHTVTEELAKASKRIDPIMNNVEVAVDQTKQTMTNANALVKNDIKMIAEHLAKLIDRVDGLVKDVSPDITAFSGEGLPNLNRLLVDARSLLDNLQRITQSLDNDPDRFLFGNRFPEYKAQ